MMYSIDQTIITGTPLKGHTPEMTKSPTSYKYVPEMRTPL